MDPAELLAGSETGGAADVICCWDSDGSVLPVVGEVLGGTAGPLSLPLLDGDEIVEEHTIVPTVP